MKVQGRVAMVTGGGSGIGRASVMALAREGAQTIVADINPANAAKVASEVTALGCQVIAVETDVSKKNQVQRIVQAGIERFGKIDILVNAAGIGASGDVKDMSEDVFDSVIAAHLKSMFLCSQAVLDPMIKKGWGRIVTITSRAAYRSRPSTAAYSAAKAGMTGFSRSLALEVAQYGITVNNVAPGVTLTGMTSNENRPATEVVQIAEQLSLGVVTKPPRYAYPEEIAEAVMYFCGPNSDHTTGMTLHVNGGSFIP